VRGIHAEVLQSAAQLVDVDATRTILVELVERLADARFDAAPRQFRLADWRAHALVRLEIPHQPLELGE